MTIQALILCEQPEAVPLNTQYPMALLSSAISKSPTQVQLSLVQTIRHDATRCPKAGTH